MRRPGADGPGAEPAIWKKFREIQAKKFGTTHNYETGFRCGILADA